MDWNRPKDDIIHDLPRGTGTFTRAMKTDPYAEYPDLLKESLDKKSKKQFDDSYRASMTFGRPKSEVIKDAETALAKMTPEVVNKDIAGLFREGKKEPWQMTREEYRDYGSKLYNKLKNEKYVNSPFHAYSEDVPHEWFEESMDKYPDNSVNQDHYRVVKKALSEGKTIPPEVLRDYPDLQLKTAKPKKRTMVEQHLDRVIWFGGFPMRRGDVMTYMGEVAKSQDPKNWLRLRDAGLLGNYQYNEQHGYPPEGTEPISLSDFRKIVDKEDSVSLQTIEDSRSARAKESDERQSNAITIESDDPKVERWERDPGSMDIQGIDTPKKHKPTARKSKTRKTQKRSNPGTELRGMR
jgi:hypothetical protein